MTSAAGSRSRRSGTLGLGSCLGIALAVLVAAAPLEASDDSIRVVPLVRDGQVLVTFELTDGLTADILDAIKTGLPATLTYTVELRLRVPVWIDRTIGSAVLSTTVQYDTLTRRHSVVRMLDGRVEEARVTEDPALVGQWMTSFQRLALFDAVSLEPNREYYVRVRARARPQTAGIFWPWGTDPSGQTKFTFLP